jgi:hypothetical protein
MRARLAALARRLSPSRPAIDQLDHGSCIVAFATADFGALRACWLSGAQNAGIAVAPSHFTHSRTPVHRDRQPSCSETDTPKLTSLRYNVLRPMPKTRAAWLLFPLQASTTRRM